MDMLNLLFTEHASKRVLNSVLPGYSNDTKNEYLEIANKYGSANQNVIGGKTKSKTNIEIIIKDPDGIFECVKTDCHILEI